MSVNPYGKSMSGADRLRGDSDQRDAAAALGALVRRALEEDIGTGDLTSAAVIAHGARARGRLCAKEAGVLSGLAAARAVFVAVDADLAFEAHLTDGARLEPGTRIATVTGAARAILTAERTALNFLQHLSGTATLTARYVERVAGTGIRILDTRKTTPGLRQLEKQAVRDGGGVNHRLGLFDAVMIKDNHIAAAGGIAAALEALQRAGADVPVVVEVRTLEEIRIAASSGVDRLLLDNFAPEEVDQAVAAARAAAAGARLEIEISGGITIDNVAAYARPGVDYISVGGLTHSVPALDIALDLEPFGS